MSESTLVRPFRGLRPARGRAREIAAPPYDVVTTAEARALAEGKPYSFFHVSRAEIDLPDGTDPYSDAVYAAAAANLETMIRKGVLARDEQPGYYVYRMTDGGTSQTGVTVAASIDAYTDERIRRHELTRPAKETDRVRQIEAVDTITGPVLLVHRNDPALDALLATASRNEPANTATVGDVRHDVWPVFDPAAVEAITRRFDAMRALYIADGHHRSAAAARVAEARRAASGGTAAEEPWNAFLAVSFPEHAVRILDYNRVVRDLGGRDPDAFLAVLAAEFDVRPSQGPVRPERRAEFGLYVGGTWYRLTLRVAPDDSDPVERLDVRLLDRLVLSRWLGIDDPRTDPRIDFIGGARGPEAVSARVDAGDMAVGFTLFPTALDDLIAVADAGRIMPPKSTWFEPKLADGLISMPLSR